ncbi:hypothetical protein V6C59_20110 [Acinetobacter bereziniae]|uniref:hypothetical protein n=1 Tax=Acinetobacter bereziniae TaxID=106648 RepID=UPI002FDA1551
MKRLLISLITLTTLTLANAEPEFKSLSKNEYQKLYDKYNAIITADKEWIKTTGSKEGFYYKSTICDAFTATNNIVNLQKSYPQYANYEVAQNFYEILLDLKISTDKIDCSTN